jgi:hypothetical protein
MSSMVLFMSACQNNKQRKEAHSNSIRFSNDSILIQPKIGIDSISFYNTNDFRSFRYKNLNFTIDSGQSVADATDNAYFQNWIELENETAGLRFTFTTPWDTNKNLTRYLPKTLQRINIWSNKTAYFGNGITIGKSTYRDVVSAFGPLPINWKNHGFIEYRDKGISFSFDTNEILTEVVLNKISE